MKQHGGAIHLFPAHVTIHVTAFLHVTHFLTNESELTGQPEGPFITKLKGSNCHLLQPRLTYLIQERYTDLWAVLVYRDSVIIKWPS